MAKISVTGAREITFNLTDFNHNENRLIAIDTLKLDLTASAEILDLLHPGFDANDYRSAPIARRFPSRGAVAAYHAVAGGEQGGVVLQPQSLVGSP